MIFYFNLLKQLYDNSGYYFNKNDIFCIIKDLNIFPNTTNNKMRQYALGNI